ncbi:MarR family transcriptional regulator [Actinoplanes sp. LDG1-06]|uniref:MarR family transcriptional regulator n=1 Tax=Paractinoplanes ovalisporus TaxID=2810368 RepID=A0ABS2A5G1_9ACTN|nr:MarR family transcriptional regulator [Actinoplanes ovalisporus]MBM2615090.1 MarR family transcriptional regulator [Actinoplanes ovalisporus]
MTSQPTLSPGEEPTLSPGEEPTLSPGEGPTLSPGEEPTLSPGEEEVVGALLALSRAFVGLAARSLADLDEEVTLPQYRTLVFLVSHGPQRIVDLAHELGVTSSTATRMCNRLARKELVARQERPDDRRAAWIVLTDGGRELVGEVMRRRRTALAEMITELSLTRPLGLAATLNALVELTGELPDTEWWRRWKTP